MHTPPTVYYGAVISPKSLREYDVLPRCLIGVSHKGVIEWIVEDVVDSMVQDQMAQNGYFEANVVDIKHGQFLMPGFVDTHTHAPQVPEVGSGQQFELLEWLNEIVFPMETKFSDLHFARQTYKSVVRRLIDCGTTTCCYYGSLHLGATKILADIVNDFGQRAFVGKCNMDRESPVTYREKSAEASVHDTKALIAHIRCLPHPHCDATIPQLVQPILTPRFAISCTDDLLTDLGKMALSDPSLAIQTHISENPAEVAYTLSLFKGCATYADVYDKFKLLRSNTVLAHAVHLEEEEIELIKRRGAGISHCPTSNFNLSSGIARIGEYLDRGIKVGLGTDVSGGFSTSMLTAIRHASIASTALSFKYAPSEPSKSEKSDEAGFSNRKFSVATLLYLATLGGAEVCNLENKIGSFAKTKSFDALLVNVRDEAGNPGLWAKVEREDLTAEEILDNMLEKFLFCGDDRNISGVYVQGKLIGGTAYQK